MWTRFDTLLIRLLALMGIAIAAAFVFSFLLAQMQHSARNGGPRNALTVAVDALQELREEGWPKTLSQRELAALDLVDYSRTKEPVGQISGDMLGEIVRERLGLGPDAEIAMSLDPERGMPALRGPSGEGGEWPVQGGIPDKGAFAGPGGHPGSFPRALASVVSLKIAPDEWVNVRTKRIAFDQGRPWVVLFVLVLLVATAIWAARNAITPLNQMAKAADVLASDYRHHALDEIGPSDVRQALRAFNRMGRQLESTVSNQRQVLAAIGHDLRTPITSLKLKTEMLSDRSERARMMRAIAELEHLTEAALIAASAGQSNEPFERLDLYSVIDSVVDELGDIGHDVLFEDTDDRPIVRGRSGELMRVVRNVVQNAISYGDRARIRLNSHSGSAIILVEDDGPGIPEESLDTVFQPLVRLELSRSRDTGGHGLGLHIAKTIVEAHHGTIRLRNRPKGGLCVEIVLPRDHG